MRRVFFVLLVMIPLMGIFAQENDEPVLIMLQAR